jgi:hypothetical protein
VVAAALSPDGASVLVLPRSDTMLLMDWANLAVLARFGGHNPGNCWLQCGFLCRSGKQPVSAFASNPDGCIEIWPIGGGAQPAVSEVLHDGPIVAAQADAGTGALVTGASRGEAVIAVWTASRDS